MGPDLKLLLDTHALLWTLSGSVKLSAKARDAIADPVTRKLVSAASAMEITTKYRIGKLSEGERLSADFSGVLAEYDYVPLAITIEHAAHAGKLPFAHGDPFDRILIAQAQLENALLVSNERLFDSFGVQRLW